MRKSIIVQTEILVNEMSNDGKMIDRLFENLDKFIQHIDKLLMN